MSLIVVGLNHRTAPVDLLERMTVPTSVSMRKVDLAIELQILSFYQLRRGGGPATRPAERAG